MFSFAFLIENMFDLTYLKNIIKRTAGMLIGHYNNKLLTDDIRYLGVGGHLFAIDEVNAKKIMEVYDYDWTDEEI